MDDLVQAQMQEMEMVRQKVYSLEQTQLAIKQRYDIQATVTLHLVTETLDKLDMRKILHVSVMNLKRVVAHRPI